MSSHSSPSHSSNSRHNSSGNTPRYAPTGTFADIIDAITDEDEDSGLEKLTAVLEGGFGVNTPNTTNNNKTPLHYACENDATGDGEIVKELLQVWKANVNVQDDNGWSPLHYACSSGEQHIVQILLEGGATVDIVDNKGSTPLLTACCTEEGVVSLSTIDDLLEAGADVNAQNAIGRTPLQSATIFGNAEIVKRLLEAGADASLGDDEGATPFDFASEDDNDELMTLLANSQRKERTGSSSQKERRDSSSSSSSTRKVGGARQTMDEKIKKRCNATFKKMAKLRYKVIEETDKRYHEQEKYRLQLIECAHNLPHDDGRGKDGRIVNMTLKKAFTLANRACNKIVKTMTKHKAKWGKFQKQFEKLDREAMEMHEKHPELCMEPPESLGDVWKQYE